MLSLFSLVSCDKEHIDENTDFYVKEIYISTYNYAVSNISNDAEIYYLSESDERNNRLTLVFNKDIAKDNKTYLFYMQTGMPIPIIPEFQESDIPYDIYSISGNVLEIWDNVPNDVSYTTPMMYSALYIPKEFRATDGSVLNTDLEIYFSGANPHTLLENTSSYNGSPETLSIFSFGDKWESMYGKERQVGYVIFEDTPLYDKNGEIIDLLTIGDNAEILDFNEEYYSVKVYRPLKKNDPKHHSNYMLKANTDIFETEHVEAIYGKISNDALKRINQPNKWGLITVYSQIGYNYYDLSDLYVSFSLFPSGSSSVKITDNHPDDVESNNIYKPLTDINIDAEFIQTLETLSYSTAIEKYGDGWIALTNPNESNGTYPLESKENHHLLTVYPDERETIERLHKLYTNRLDADWEEMDSNIKTKFSDFKQACKKFSEIWYEWSKIDKNVTRESYISLVKKHFSDTDIASHTIDEYFNNDVDLIYLIGLFKEELFYPQSEVNKAREGLNVIITYPPQNIPNNNENHASNRWGIEFDAAKERGNVEIGGTILNINESQAVIKVAAITDMGEGKYNSENINISIGDEVNVIFECSYDDLSDYIGAGVWAYGIYDEEKKTVIIENELMFHIPSAFAHEH